MFKRKFYLALLVLSATCTAVLAEGLDSAKVVKLDEVIINATRSGSNLKDAPHTVQVIDKSSIETIAANDLGQLLKKTSGVDIVEYPAVSAGIGMRGFAPSTENKYTVLLVNGVPAGTNNIATLDLGNSSQVEVLKGPYSSIYGSGAMAGVINIVETRSTGNVKGSAGAAFGSYYTSKYFGHLGGSINKKFNFDLGFSAHVQTEDYKTGDNNLLSMDSEEMIIMDSSSYGKVYENTTFQKYNVNLRIGYEPNKNWQLDLFTNYFNANNVTSNGTFWGVYGSDSKDIDRKSMRFSSKYTGKNNTILLTPYYSHEVTNYYDDISDTSFVTSKYFYNEYGFQLQDRVQLGSHNLVAGFDNNTRRYVTEQWAKADSMADPFQPDYYNTNYSLFAQLNMNFFQNKLNVSFGVRNDNILFHLYETEGLDNEDETKSYSILNPNVALKYEIIKNLRVHSSAGRAFYAPDAFQIAGNYSYYYGMWRSNYKGNPDLEPEKSYTVDLGISFYNLEKGINADITYFSTWHKDMIVYDRITYIDTTTFMNANSSQTQGIELGFSYDFGALADYKYSLKVYVNYTHLFKYDVTIDTIVEPMKYVRIDKAAFGIDFQSGNGIELRLNGRYTGHRYEDNWLYTYDNTTYERIPYTLENGSLLRPELVNTDVIYYPDFLLFDAFAGYTFKGKYSIGIYFNNIFNDNYAEKDGSYMPGRNYQISLKATI